MRAVSGQPSSVVIFAFGFPIDKAEVAKPKEVPISKMELGWKYCEIRNSNSARRAEIPAVFAIFEIGLLFDLKTLEPAPKSVTAMLLLFSNNSSRNFFNVAYSDFDVLS